MLTGKLKTILLRYGKMWQVCSMFSILTDFYVFFILNSRYHKKAWVYLTCRKKEGLITFDSYLSSSLWEEDTQFMLIWRLYSFFSAFMRSVIADWSEWSIGENRITKIPKIHQTEQDELEVLRDQGHLSHLPSSHISKLAGKFKKRDCYSFNIIGKIFHQWLYCCTFCYTENFILSVSYYSYSKNILKIVHC